MSIQRLNINWEWNSFLSYRRRKNEGIKTGLTKLDSLLGGLAGVVVAQGAPGCNKSTFVLQVALFQAGLGNPVLLIDRENGREYARERILAALNQVSGWTVRSASIEELKKFKLKAKDLPLYIETDSVSILTIKNYLAEMDNLHGGNRPIMLVVDSIQALPSLAASERESLQNWMKEFDQLKLDYSGRLVILATSEKRRGEAGQEYDRASLSAGKGAGAIEYKAERVLDFRRNRQSGGIICEIVKNREGVSGVSVDLDLVYEIPDNPNSFCYLLKEAL